MPKFWWNITSQSKILDSIIKLDQEAPKTYQKYTANTLKQSLIENLVSNGKEQSQNNTLVEYTSLFNMERMINPDEQILQLTKIHTLYGTNYVHRVPEERYDWDKFEIMLSH